MKLRLTTLTENTAMMSGVLAEWGLSILIETKEANILFDTGPSISAIYNAGILGVDLGKIDTIVLSHSHSDHTGGLREVLRMVRPKKKEIEIIAHPDIWAAKYGHLEGEESHYIGIPFHRQTLESLGAKFRLTRYRGGRLPLSPYPCGAVFALTRQCGQSGRGLRQSYQSGLNQCP